MEASSEANDSSYEANDSYYYTSASGIVLDFRYDSLDYFMNKCRFRLLRLSRRRACHERGSSRFHGICLRDRGNHEPTGYFRHFNSARVSQDFDALVSQLLFAINRLCRGKKRFATICTLLRYNACRAVVLVVERDLQLLLPNFFEFATWNHHSFSKADTNACV